MLDYSILKPEDIPVLKPQSSLKKEDFAGLSAAFDSYLADHAKLHGVMMCSKDFPGWKNLDGFTAHMHFVREHHRKIERVAIVTDSHFAGIAESVAKHFTSAEVRRFQFLDEAKALDWLETA